MLLEDRAEEWRECKGCDGYTKGKPDFIEDGSWTQDEQLLPPRCAPLG